MLRHGKWEVLFGHSGEDAKRTTEETTLEAEQGVWAGETEREDEGHSARSPGTDPRSSDGEALAKGQRRSAQQGRRSTQKPKMRQRSVGQMLPSVTGAQGCWP